MSGDSKTVEDTKRGSLTEVTEIDDSCTLQFIEIVPVDRVSDDCHRQLWQYTDRVVEVKPEDLQDVKQEPADECENEGQCFTIEVSSACTQQTEHYVQHHCETWMRLFLQHHCLYYCYG